MKNEVFQFFLYFRREGGKSELLGVPRTGSAFGLSSFSQRFECPVRSVAWGTVAWRWSLGAPKSGRPGFKSCLSFLPGV